MSSNKTITLGSMIRIKFHFTQGFLQGIFQTLIVWVMNEEVSIFVKSAELAHGFNNVSD